MLAHLSGVEAHHGHGVGAHRGGVLHHAVERLAAGVLIELDVGADLAPGEAPGASRDPAARLPLPLDVLDTTSLS
jgi:hypothetical protein